MTMSNLYKTANKVRTKLLLFIDKEIQSRQKTNSKFIQRGNTECTSLIHLEETFSQIESIYFSPIKIYKKVIAAEISERTDKHKNKISKNDMIYKFKIPQNKNIEIHFDNLHRKTDPEGKNDICFNSSVYKKTYSTLNTNLIRFKEKVYSMKVKRKTSSVLEIYSKPKKDKKYLIELCNNLKIMRPKLSKQKSSTLLRKNFAKSKCTFTRLATTHSLKSFKKNNNGSLTCRNINKNKEVKSKFKKKESLFKKFAKKNNLIPHNVEVSFISSKK